MSPKESAQWLAANFGWYVFPTKDKKPANGVKWKEVASNVPDDIDEMPWEGATAPGIYCGKSGIAVLDIDTDEGGNALLQTFKRKGEMPQSMWQETPRGGQHWIYKAPPFEQSIGTGIPVEGVDIRAGDGYICWYGQGIGIDWELTPWPYDKVIAKKSAAPIPESSGKLSLVVNEGNRNHDLASQCGAILRSEPGISKQSYLAQALSWSRNVHKPPLPPEEVRLTAASIWKTHFTGEAEKAVKTLREVVAAADGVVALDDLLQRLYAPTRFVCDPFIAEGYTLFSGPPKIGKTTLMRQLMCATVTGGEFLGESCERSEVLFLCLEESEKLFMKKMRAMGAGAQHAALRIAFEWPRGQAGLDALDEYMKSRPNTKLIVIDSYAAFKAPIGATKESPFDLDYRIGLQFQQFCKRHPGLALVVLVHNRKMEAESALDRVSGTYGVTAAADQIGVMFHNPTGYYMHWTGRNWDSEESDFSIIRDSGVWRMGGPVNPALAAMHGNAGLQGEIVAILEGLPYPMALTELAEKLRKDKGNVSRACSLMVDRGVLRKVNGKFVLK